MAGNRIEQKVTSVPKEFLEGLWQNPWVGRIAVVTGLGIVIGCTADPPPVVTQEAEPADVEGLQLESLANALGDNPDYSGLTRDFQMYLPGATLSSMVATPESQAGIVAMIAPVNGEQRPVWAVVPMDLEALAGRPTVEPQLFLLVDEVDVASDSDGRVVTSLPVMPTGEDADRQEGETVSLETADGKEFYLVISPDQVIRLSQDQMSQMGGADLLSRIAAATQAAVEPTATPAPTQTQTESGTKSEPDQESVQQDPTEVVAEPELKPLEFQELDFDHLPYPRMEYFTHSGMREIPWGVFRDEALGQDFRLTLDGTGMAQDGIGLSVVSAAIAGVPKFDAGDHTIHIPLAYPEKKRCGKAIYSRFPYKIDAGW